MSLLFILPALAGAPADFSPGVEGQWGFGPPSISADGSQVALTRWDRSGLWVWDRTTGTVKAVSDARGVGFRPAWSGDTLWFKSVDEDGQAVVRWTDGAMKEIARAPQIGQPLPGPPGVLWSRKGAIERLEGETIRSLGAGPWVDLYEPAPNGDMAAWHDRSGNLWVTDHRTGTSKQLSVEGGASHPRWSDDGAYLSQVLADRFEIVAVDGRVLPLNGRDPAWVPGTHTVVYTQMVTVGDLGPQYGANPYVVLGSTLWSYDVDTGIERLLLDAPQLHPRHAAPLPDGDGLLFVDGISGALWRLGPQGLQHELDAPNAAAAPPPPSSSQVSVSVPYMHQLWDTPDEFDGGWSCGPTSLLQTMQKWSVLPDWDITASWPYAHTSHWGNYVPYTYAYNGYTYDYTGVAASSNCQGAHGFVCREYGGAVWSYMVLFLQQHGLWADYAGTDYNTLLSETSAGWPMVASVSVLGYGHIISVRGFVTVDGSAIHTIVVNDPYGNAGSGDWGNFDGEGIVYDWPGYNNGNLEISISELFYAHGTAPVEETPTEETPTEETPTEETPTQETPTDTAVPTEPPDDTAPRSAGLPGDTVVMDHGGCHTAPGTPGALAFAAVLHILGRRRPR